MDLKLISLLILIPLNGLSIHSKFVIVYIRDYEENK